MLRSGCADRGTLVLRSSTAVSQLQRTSRMVRATRPVLPGTTDPYYLRELTEGQYGRCHARERRKKRRHECCEPARALFHSALFFFLPSSNFSIRSANAGSL